MKFRSKACNELILQLEELLTSSSPSTQLRRLLNDLRRQADDAQLSEVRHENPERINHDFSEKLQARFPHLTRAERELCALFLLDVSVQEIANLRKITPPSVRMGKYRLRIRLGLEEGQDLSQFLRRL